MKECLNTSCKQTELYRMYCRCIVSIELCGTGPDFLNIVENNFNCQHHKYRSQMIIPRFMHKDCISKILYKIHNF